LLGKNKDAAIGFGVIAVIIVVIVGVVMAVLPEESEITQSELVENELIIPNSDLDFETKKDLLTTAVNNDPRYLSLSDEEIDALVDLTVSLDDYRRTNEILEGYSTVEILIDILDDENGKITELDRRMEYHSAAEPKDGFDMENLLFDIELIKQADGRCKGNITHTLEFVLPGLGVHLQYLIKDGYAKDPSVTPTLNKIANALLDYKECAGSLEY